MNIITDGREPHRAPLPLEKLQAIDLDDLGEEESSGVSYRSASIAQIRMALKHMFMQINVN